MFWLRPAINLRGLQEPLLNSHYWGNVRYPRLYTLLFSNTNNGPHEKMEKSFCCINIWFVSPHNIQVVCCPHQNHPPTNWGGTLINRVGDKFHQINWMDIIVLSIQLRSIRSKINTWTKTDRFQNAPTFGQIDKSMKYFQLLS